MADSGSYSASDEMLAIALATGQTIRDAAAAADISERTAYRRSADAEFQRLVRRLRGEMVSRAIGKLSSGMTGAADALTELLQDPDPSIRYKAAVKLLDIGFVADEHDRLEAELNELKAIVNVAPQGELP